MTSDRQPVLRRTSRVLLYDRDARVLLFRTLAPDTSGVSRWITPGGGVDPGEEHLDAAVRELFEETGLVLAPASLGEPVWSLDFAVEWDAADHDTGHAEYYVARTARFDPSNEHWTPEELVEVTAHRWWTADELESSGELFEPAELPALIRRFADTPEGD